MWEVLQFEFMRNALFAGILVSITCGIIGTLVVVNRIVFISGGIAHAAYGGIGMAFYTGLPPFLGAALFSFAVSMVMGVASLRDKQRVDAIIGVMWAIGMALGIIFIDLTPGYHVDLMSYLFGSILTVVTMDIWFMLSLNMILILIVFVFYKEFLAVSYDEEFSFVVGIPVRTLYFVLLGMIALSVVMIIKIVGIILVIALISIPPYIAEKYTTSLGKMMILSSVLGILFTLAGLWLSYNYDLTSGATIILVAGLGFFVSLASDFIRRPSTESPS
ncbi:MAG: metal ABC transporter permease [Deltaproteobacteria bacterium]|nr:metal ABC transporter permease [Deltaproteobacteria bacterium]